MKDFYNEKQRKQFCSYLIIIVDGAAFKQTDVAPESAALPGF